MVLDEVIMKKSYVYILANKRNGTLCIGVTSDIIKRIYQHKNDLMEGFSNKYQTHLLVYFEEHGDITEALSREKQIKKWERQWRLNLIEKKNPHWNDLYKNII